MPSIGYIPPEILAGIFVEACDWDPPTCAFGVAASVFGNLKTAGPPPPISLDMHRHIWPLTYVCRLWRETAISLSTVWSNIEITLPKEGTIRVTPHSADILNTILIRANGHPIRIQLDIMSDTPLVGSVALLDIAMEHSTMWREFSLAISPELLPRLQSIKNKLPLLETLSLSPAPRSVHDQTLALSDVADVFVAAPKLHSVTFSRCREVVALDLPWAQLKQFDLDTGRTEKIDRLGLVTKLTNLQSLVLNSEDNWDSSSKVILPQVRRLCCQDYRRELDFLVLPRLEQLTNVYVVSGLSTFIHSSKCSLKALRLKLGGGRPENNFESVLSDLLRATPDLTDLSLSWHLGRRSLVRLTEVLTDAAILPRLHTLEITLFGLVTFPNQIEALVSVLYSRERPPQRVIFTADVDFVTDGFGGTILERYREICIRFKDMFSNKMDICVVGKESTIFSSK